MPNTAEPVQLHEQTLNAYTEYVTKAEAEASCCLDQGLPFLWCDSSPERAQHIANGRTVAEMWSGNDPIHVPHGLIHDWVGATCIPDATVDNTLALLQNYDQHKHIYAPDVIDSRLLSRSGDVFDIYLRLRKKKVLTVVLDTDHHVEYTAVSATQWCLRSHTTRVAEVEDAGEETERVGQPDTGYGYLWRLASYWRLDQRNGAVWVECRTISLTRDVPKGLGWMIEPIVRKLPRQSLIDTLEATRRGYGTRFGESARAPLAGQLN